MKHPYGRWVMLDRLPDEPIIAFVYFDPHAGPSAKGGLASEANLVTMPSRTLRLSDKTAIRELTAEEARARSLPARPPWVDQYGRQPDPEAPWHNDPLLADKFSDKAPDDIQTLVHDGDPRRMRRGPELCWVRILRVERAPTRRLALGDDVGATAGEGRAPAPPPPVEPSRHVYIGELLGSPHTLKSVAKGARIKLISVHGLPHPLHVTEEYLREREDWVIKPCDRCGATECFDPPSVMAAVRFPDAPVGSVIERFTSFCSHCGGIQELSRTPR